MSDTVEWRWVDIDGSQSALRFDQLADALSSGSLPRFVLVWRTGWTDWFSAERVADLASAVGTVHSSPLTAVRIIEGVTSPPPPPLDRYATLAPGHEGTLLKAKHKGPLSTVPPPPPPRPGGRPLHPPPRAPVAGIPAPPAFMASAPIPVRDVLPTLAGEEPMVRSQTLRPVGGMAPPPRAMPQTKIPDIDDEESEDLTADIDLGGGSDEAEAAPSPPPQPARAEHTPPPMPVAAVPFQKPVAPPELVVTQRSETEARATPRPVRPGARQAQDLRGASRQAVSRATAIGVLIPGTLLLTAALIRIALKPPRSETRVGAAVVASAAPSPRVKPGCSLDRAATRLSESAFVGVPLLATTAPGGERAAIGFASTKEHAVGLTVDPTSLQVTLSFEQTVTDSATLGVVPLARSGMLQFAVDRADPKLASSRTIDAPIPFSIGVTAEGFSRAIGSQHTLIWPGKSKNPTITTPRVASVPGLGHAVAFRHSGQEGKVLVGWLTEAGEKLTDVKAVGTDAVLVGTPAISASESGLLVAFASKTGPAEGWRIELAAAPRGGIPERAGPMAIPPGGPGGEAISPSTETLAAGRFVLQWTEGSAGNRAVRTQMLSSDLVPIGEPITLSTPEQNAGQGALWVHGSRALALFLVKKESSHELWGASLRCP